jgi:hypothetical protein
MANLPPSYSDFNSSGYTNWATQLPADRAPAQQQNASTNDVPTAPPPTYNSSFDQTPILTPRRVPMHALECSKLVGARPPP